MGGWAGDQGEEGRDNWGFVCTGQTPAAPYIPRASQAGQGWELQTLYGAGHTNEQEGIWGNMKDLIQRVEEGGKLMQLYTTGYEESCGHCGSGVCQSPGASWSSTAYQYFNPRCPGQGPKHMVS